jgi:serine protease Do
MRGIATGADTSSSIREQIDRAIARVKPALVRIRVVSDEYRDGREVKVQEVGSGAIITKDGYLITNHHVAGHAARMFCTLWNREEIEADLVGTDPLTDIAVLKLRPEKPRTFTSAVFGDSSRMRVGDTVLAMGSPMALSQSVTLGILSNTEMVMPAFFGPGGQFRLDGEDVGSLVRWFAHDAAIYGGNSGGPLINLNGEIVGINEISYGLSGAIPGNLARTIAMELIVKHHISRSWLGLDAQPLFKRSRATHGILVSSVVEGSPAAAAGIRAGDILLKLNQVPVDVHFEEEMPDFMWLISTLPIGKPVIAVIERGGKETEVQMAPLERGRIFLPQQEIKQWGLVARDYSFLLAKELKRTNTDGVLISSVRPGGPAGECKPPLEAEDTLIEVNQTPIKNVQELVDLTRKLTAGKTDPVPVMAVFERKAERFITVVKVGIEDLKDPGLEVSKAWLPVEAHVISREIADQLGEPDLKGFYITHVYPDSTAEKAGLQPGDFIVAVDGEKLMASGAEYEDELTTLIRQYDIGKSVELSILRKKTPLKISVELTRSPRLEREMKKYRNDDFEFTARDISFFDADEEQWKTGEHGALVEEVKPGSWAELGSLYGGDLILQVDGQPVENVDGLRRDMEQVAAAKKSVVTMKVLRGIRTLYLEFEPNWKN